MDLPGWHLYAYSHLDGHVLGDPGYKRRLLRYAFLGVTYSIAFLPARSQATCEHRVPCSMASCCQMDAAEHGWEYVRAAKCGPAFERRLWVLAHCF